MKLPRKTKGFMTKVKVPSQIKIGATIIRIRHSGKWDKWCDDKRVYGYFGGDYKGRNITLDGRQTECEFSSTLIHEFLEAIRGINGLSLSHSTLGTLNIGLHQILEQMGVRFVK